jgi:PEP-CTERM motif
MIDQCTWDAPGADRYTGTTAAAVAYYTDIPEAARRGLLRKVDRHEFDDMVVITRDAVAGTHEYSAVITSMHFGSKGKVCSTVTRNKWSDTASEGGLVYCAEEHCILVPAVCGNVARVTRRAAPVAPLAATGLLPAETFEQGMLPDAATAAEPEQAAAVVFSPVVVYSSGSVPIAYTPAGGAIAAAVPEPSTYALMLLGLASILYLKRKAK